MIYFRDPEKQAKLEEAIQRGFIQRTLDAYGVYRYTLTQQGQIQWLLEKGVQHTSFSFKV